MHRPLALPERRAFFQEHGWLVLRGAVDGATLAEVRAVYDELMAPHLGPGGLARPVDGVALCQLPDAARARPAVIAHLTRGGLAELAGTLLGDEQIRLLQDTLILKGAGPGGRIDLHQDYSYTGYLDPPKTLSLRLALTRETHRGGCLWVIDGSHRWGLVGGFEVLTTSLRSARERLRAEQAEQLDGRRVLLELAPGDVSIHHCLTLHGSDENHTAAPRKTVVTHVFSGVCVLVPERLPDPAAARRFPTDEAGRLVGDGFPVLFERPRDACRRTRSSGTSGSCRAGTDPASDVSSRQEPIR